MNKIKCFHCGEELNISEMYCCAKDGKVIAEGHKRCVMMYGEKKEILDQITEVNDVYELKHVEGNEYKLLMYDSEIATIYTTKDTFEWDLKRMVKLANEAKL